MIDRTKAMFFNGEYQGKIALDYMPPEKAQRWKAEAAALNCATCNDENCPVRFNGDRLPADAGGKSQCLRWAQEFTPLAWRNPDGYVIIMPQEVFDTIRA